MTLIPYGSKSWLVQWDSREACDQVAPFLMQGLEDSPPEDFLEYISGYQTLLLIFISPVTQAKLLTYLNTLTGQKGVAEPKARHLEIPVTYNGPDLSYVAETHQMTCQEVILRHSEPSYTVYFMGFSPGFPYLGPLDTLLHTPRRKSPRTRIPQGAVAIGGSHTGIYSVDSPGGWNIIGHTSYPLFQLAHAKNNSDATRNIFSLHPGDHVKFVPQLPDAL
ncbi:MAG: 5-oxoprolinase subunit PxpB [Verrucomicrobiota bacterium]